ncbi:MAG: SDR family oxidoreductase [Clostridiales Family XIII bacterium]|jgi:3-oxoacyl-[acyl-carrier protein] reductase|nr:SDR family oxidoreductase [Clostridiales Family XIII bacterium]
MGKLTGKTALITGAARGLGRSYALHLASLGADVGIIDINLKSYAEFESEAALLTADTVMEEVEALGVKSAGAVADVSDFDQVKRAVDEIVAALGPIDILVCNAGGGSGALTANKASEIDLEQYHTVLERNLTGTVNTVLAVAPIMKERNAGKIINVTSHTGQIATSTGSYAHYSIAKAAILHYTRVLAQDLGRYNINVNCISPGFIATGRMAVGFKAVGEEKFLDALALKRFGTPEDCAKVVEFLATDLSDYVTGVCIEITGGSGERLTLNI